MFTLTQIQAAYAKVKSGADFPAYVQNLMGLGIKQYDTFVSDGRSIYFGEANYIITSNGKYPLLEISEESDKTKFNHYLKIHQQGETDYPTFCQHAAQTGVYKWTVDFEKMTCTYFDKMGDEILVEKLLGF